MAASVYDDHVVQDEDFIPYCTLRRRADLPLYRVCVWRNGPLKGTGHYWYLLKIIVISIKTCLVTSNGELFITQTLWQAASSDVASLWERGNFLLEYPNASGLKYFNISFIRPLRKHTQLCNKSVFSFIATSMFTWVKWTQNVDFCSHVCYFMHMPMLGYTKWEYWSLKIIQRVSIAFKRWANHFQ